MPSSTPPSSALLRHTGFAAVPPPPAGTMSGTDLAFFSFEPCLLSFAIETPSLKIEISFEIDRGLIQVLTQTVVASSAIIDAAHVEADSQARVSFPHQRSAEHTS